MYFMLKEEKVFEKYMEIWEEVSNTIKKIILNLYIVKNILQLKTHSTQKKVFNVFIKK